MHLKGKAAIVTGSGRGIGREIALLMGKLGANVIVNDPGVDRGGSGQDQSVAESVVKEIKAAGGNAAANTNSVTDYNQAGQMIKQAIDTFGGIDIVVNVAGFLREKMIWNMSEDDWDSVINVHLKGHWNMCHHAAKEMRVRRKGRIINFSSDAFKGSVGQCNYSAAKGAIISLTRSISREMGRFGVTANAICPIAATRMTLNDKVIEGMKKRYEAGLVTKAFYENFMAMPGPEYIAPMVCYLATDQAKDINGQTFHVEKGKIHTYAEPTEYRTIFQVENKGMFSVDQLIDCVPNTLMQGVPNLSPAEKEEKAAS